MNALSSILSALTLAALLAACDRGGSEVQRLADERAALEREKAKLADEKAAAGRDALEEERARLAEERAALGEDHAKLSTRAKADREARLAAELRAKEESGARKAVEERAKSSVQTAAQNAAVQARAEQSVEFFYEALDAHGDWIKVERYGHCWQPAAARNPRWRPYTDGGWVFTDYGWTWRANEPFGWATYHYGRWTRLPRLGWVWVPGTEWGPAWVSWRRSDDYIGWAPLPPDAWSSSGFTAAVDSYYDIGPGLYTFVPVADFGEQTYVGRVVEPEKNVTIVNQTTNVTNVTYKTVQNNVTVVNNGPDITVINERSRTPVQRLAVERVTSDTGASKAAKVEGKTLQMIAPFFKDRAPAAVPKRVKEEVAEAKEERGWEEAKDEAPKIREQAAKRARQAEDEQRVDGATEESTRRRVRVVPADGTPSAPAPALDPDKLEAVLPRAATPLPAPAPSARPAPPKSESAEKSGAAERKAPREKKPPSAETEVPAVPKSSAAPAAPPAAAPEPAAPAPVRTKTPAAAPASEPPATAPSPASSKSPAAPPDSDSAPAARAPVKTKSPAAPPTSDPSATIPALPSSKSPATPPPSDPAPAAPASAKSPATPPASSPPEKAPVPANASDPEPPDADRAAPDASNAERDAATKAARREQRKKREGSPPESDAPPSGPPAPR